MSVYLSMHAQSILTPSFLDHSFFFMKRRGKKRKRKEKERKGKEKEKGINPLQPSNRRSQVSLAPSAGIPGKEKVTIGIENGDLEDKEKEKKEKRGIGKRKGWFGQV